MNKTEFLAALKNALNALPASEAERSLNYYSEMLDDRIEDGMSEYEAVAALGSVDSIAEGIICDTPLGVLVKERAKTRVRPGVFAIILIIIGFPLWFPLLLTVAACALSVYIVVWAVIVTMFAVVLSFVLSGLAALCIGVWWLFENPVAGLGIVGAGLILAGLAIIAFPLSKLAAQGLIWLTKLFARGIKRLFIRKDNAE